MKAITTRLCALLCTVLTGCASLDQQITAAPADSRVIEAPHISWIASTDMKKICHALGQVAGKGSLGESDHGCSIFNPKLQSCTIFTLPETSHAVLGHELHHCFEGHFHAQAAIAKTLANAPTCKAPTEDNIQ